MAHRIEVQAEVQLACSVQRQSVQHSRPQRRRRCRRPRLLRSPAAAASLSAPVRLAAVLFTAPATPLAAPLAASVARPAASLAASVALSTGPPPVPCGKYSAILQGRQ